MEEYQRFKNEDVLTNKNPQMTKDTLFDGKIICWQHAHGYRFSIDSILVSHFPKINQQEIVLDLGTGCGVVGLILLYRHHDKQIHITGYEKQEDLVALAKKNSLANCFSDNYQIISGDVKKIRENFTPESFSLVICNPPFYAAGIGRTSLSQESLHARHLTADGIKSFVEGAAYCVKNRGRIVFIYPAERLMELLY
ncbi:MAG: methyltransferase, partial [Deltaproteobacteria bacterium]|nr:methyltransferase [Deltaproteobacteria bacterium]